MALLTAAKGLKTQANALARPDGALVVADNVVIDYDNSIQKRRGFKEFNSLVFGDNLMIQLALVFSLTLAVITPS
jgi:hypothetical protein